MKRVILVMGGLMMGAFLFLSCAKEKVNIAPSGADVLVLTSPGGTVPGNISAIETSTGTVYDDILSGGTGEIPNEMHLRDSTLWIVNSAQGSVQLVDVSEKGGKLSLSTRGRVYLPSDSWPEYMAFLGDKAYVTLYKKNSVVILDTIQNIVTGEIAFPDTASCQSWYQKFAPWGIAVTGTSVFVAGTGVSPGALIGINGNMDSITFVTSTTRANAESIAISSDSILITTGDWCGTTNGSFEVFNTAGQRFTSISLGAPLGAIAIANGKAYIGDISYTGAKLYIVDIRDFNVIRGSDNPLIASTNTGINFITGIRVGPKGQVYACGWGSKGGEVYEIDPATDTVKKIYTIKGPALDVAFRY